MRSRMEPFSVSLQAIQVGTIALPPNTCFSAPFVLQILPMGLVSIQRRVDEGVKAQTQRQSGWFDRPGGVCMIKKLRSPGTWQAVPGSLVGTKRPLRVRQRHVSCTPSLPRTHNGDGIFTEVFCSTPTVLLDDFRCTEKLTRRFSVAPMVIIGQSQR